MIKKSLTLLAAFTLAPSLGAFAQTPAGLTVQILQIFDYPGTGNLTRPQKINDKGDVAGQYADAGGVTRGFIRFKNGTFSAPIVDPDDTGNDTELRGINNARTACGEYLVSETQTYHGLFLSGNTITNYDVPGSTTTILLGINNAGDFCGAVTPTGDIEQAFTSIGGVVTDFVPAGATSALAYSINDSNQTCGYYVDSAAIFHGFYRDANGTIHSPVDAPASTATILFGNNNRNYIVGRYTDSANVTHGLIFIPPHKFSTYDYPGGTFTSLNGINTSGMVTGRYTDTAGIDHGFTGKLISSTSSAVLAPRATTQAREVTSADQPSHSAEPAY